MKKFTITILTTIFLFMSFWVQAVPAYPGLIEFSQPDGSELNIFMYGDEKISWAETLDGYSLMYNKNGFYEYAVLNDNNDMIPSGVIAKEINKRSQEEIDFLKTVTKHLRYSRSQISIVHQIWNMKESESSKFPTTGERDLVCILIGFQDRPFAESNATFNDLFNQIGYTTGGATGSVKDFYLETSYNQLDLSVTVAGPYLAANNMAYYGANSGNNHSVNADELVIEALNFADPTVDFTQFDNDDDGTIDAVYIIFAGYGEEAGGGVNTIWSHAGYIPVQVLDGKTIDRYSCSPEYRSNFGSNLTRIGVICHEFGHVLGAKDFYDTDYSTGGNFIGTGSWDLMAGGSWNNNGATPAHPNAYIKTNTYDWAVANTFSPGSITLENSVEFDNSFYRYETKTQGEYYLCENRQQIGFDSYTPGHGLLIYHVSAVISGNPNATHPQQMYPVCATAPSDPNSNPYSYGAINSSGCTFPGSGNKIAFSDHTTPSSISWEGRFSYKPIKNVTENTTDNTVTFCFDCEDVQNFMGVPISDTQIDVSWDQNLTNDDIMLVFNTSETFGIPINGQSYNPGETISGGGTVIYSGDLLSFSHDNLDGNTIYFYKAFSIFSGNNYSDGTVTEARTFCSAVTVLPLEEGFEVPGTDIPDCWTFYTGENGLGELQNWRTSTSSNTGSYAAFIQFEDVSGDLAEDWLVSPQIEIPSGTDIVLQYYEKQYASADNNANFHIKVSESSQTSHASFVNLLTYGESTFETTYSQRVIDLNSYAGKSIFIAFVLEQDALGDAWYIDDFRVGSAVGIVDKPKFGLSKIFPNPAKGSFTVISDTDKIYTVAIRDITGKIIFRDGNKNSGKRSIDISDKAKGIYFIELQFKNNVEVHKLIIE